jgi:hypothetical protein
VHTNTEAKPETKKVRGKRGILDQMALPKKGKSIAV